MDNSTRHCATSQLRPQINVNKKINSVLPPNVGEPNDKHPQKSNHQQPFCHMARPNLRSRKQILAGFCGHSQRSPGTTPEKLALYKTHRGATHRTHSFQDGKGICHDHHHQRPSKPHRQRLIRPHRKISNNIVSRSQIHICTLRLRCQCHLSRANEEPLGSRTHPGLQQAPPTFNNQWL